MNYEAIIFDLDGTLWDANKSCTKAWNDVLKELNYKNKITLKGMNSVTGKPMDDCIDILLPKIKDDYPNIKQLFINKEKEIIELDGGYIYPNVKKRISDLSINYKLFIVSNCQEWYLLKFLNYTGLIKNFTDWDCFGKSLTSKDKMISTIIKKYNIKKSIYIGDTIIDFEAAKKSDIDFVQLTYGFGESIEDAIKFSNFEELYLFLNKSLK